MIEEKTTQRFMSAKQDVTSTHTSRASESLEVFSLCCSYEKAWEQNSYPTGDKPELNSLNSTVSDSQSGPIFNLCSLVTRYLDTLEYVLDASCFKISLFTEVRSV